MWIASPTSVRRRLLRLLLWASLVLTAALAGLVAVLLALDANAYRPALQRELSATLGRDVSIGNLAYTVSLRPTFAIRDLRVANPAWASRPDFAAAASGEIQIDLIALWRGRVEIRRVALHGLDVQLERSGDGTGNWLLARSREAPGSVKLPDFDAIAVDNMRLRWRGPAGMVREARIERAQAVARADRPFQLEVDGTFADTALHGTATANSSLHSALAGQPWEVSIMLAGAQAQADIFVTLPRPFSANGVDVKLSVKGEQLRALSSVARTALPAWGPFRVSGHARYADASVRVDGIASSLEGLPGRPSRIEITSGEALIGEVMDTRLKLSGKLGDTAFVFDATAPALPKLAREGTPMPISARVVLGRLALEATGTASMSAGTPKFSFVVRAKGDALAPLPVVTAQRPHTVVPLDLSARVSGDKQRYNIAGLEGSVAGCTIDGKLALDATARPRLSGTLTLGRLDLKALDFGPVDGTPSRPAWLDAIDATLGLRVGAVAGLPVPLEGLSAEAELSDGRLSVKVLRGSIARTPVEGEAALQWVGARPRLDASVRILVLDLANLAQPQNTHADPEAAGGWLDAPLPLGPLRAADAGLRLEIGRVDGAPVPLRNVQAQARLTGGRLVLAPVSLIAAGAPLQGKLSFDVSGAEPSVQTSVSAAGVDVANVLRAAEGTADLSADSGPLKLRIDTRGATVRTMIAQAHVAAHVGPGKLLAGDQREPIAIQHATLEAARGPPAILRAEAALRDAPIELTVKGGPLLELLDLEHAWPEITAELRTALRGQDLQVAAASGTLKRWIDGRDVPFEVTAQLPGARAQISGKFAELRHAGRTPVHAELSIDSLAGLAPMLEGTKLPGIPLTASGSMQWGGSSVSIRDLVLQAGDTDLSGRIDVGRASRVKVDADLASQRLDLTPWLRAGDDGQPAASAARFAGTPPWHGSHHPACCAGTPPRAGGECLFPPLLSQGSQDMPLDTGLLFRAHSPAPAGY